MNLRFYYQFPKWSSQAVKIKLEWLALAKFKNMNSFCMFFRKKSERHYPVEFTVVDLVTPIMTSNLIGLHIVLPSWVSTHWSYLEMGKWKWNCQMNGQFLVAQFRRSVERTRMIPLLFPWFDSVGEENCWSLNSYLIVLIIVLVFHMLPEPGKEPGRRKLEPCAVNRGRIRTI